MDFCLSHMAALSVPKRRKRKSFQNELPGFVHVGSSKFL
jgi:hypothetical protein